ncbi:hypothetical protein [Roseateles sp.]|uniref:hypothetical protein n=1 Tax=Roseateles sp. TaxID=1971397 RepID=UPI003D135EB0
MLEMKSEKEGAERNIGTCQVFGRPWLRRVLLCWASWAAVVLAAVPTQAAETGTVIVGRADADSLPGVSLGLLLLDRPRRVLTLRLRDGARPGAAGSPWREVDAAGLRKIDRFAAPRLQLRREPEPCQFSLRWGALPPPPPALHGSTEREHLLHALCPDADCEQPAWQTDLPADAQTLALRAWLLADARSEAELVLYVLDLQAGSGSAGEYRLAGLPTLPSLSWKGRDAPWSWSQAPVRLPLELAAQFPQLFRAVWAEQARQQKRGEASLLFSSEWVNGLHALRRSRYLDLQTHELLALGAPELLASLKTAQLHRLHLRLRAADAPEQLSLQKLPRAGAGSRSWLAIQAAQDDGAQCSAHLATLSCAALCHERIERVALDPPGTYLLEPRRGELPESRSEQMQACRASCNAQMERLAADAQDYASEGRDQARQELLDGLRRMTGPGFFAAEPHP